MSIRTLFLGRERALFAAVALSLMASLSPPALAAGEEVTVYKDPNCGCCGKWVDHMRSQGFKVKEIATPKMGEVKREAGVPAALSSCHTARVGNYIVEGHVPAADVKRLLTLKPQIAGIAAPGMPQGSPGMEGPFPADRYEVVSFDGKGVTATFARH